MTQIQTRFPGKKILVAEDYFVNQEVIQDILEMMKCQVDLAENGQQAVDLFSNNSYDLIFMDVQMPQKDGFMATQEIRQKEKGMGKKTPIIALTANALTGDREKCLDAGMDDYVTKPVEAPKIEQILKKYLQQ